MAIPAAMARNDRANVFRVGALSRMGLLVRDADSRPSLRREPNPGSAEEVAQHRRVGVGPVDVGEMPPAGERVEGRVPVRDPEERPQIRSDEGIVVRLHEQDRQ